MNTHVDFNTAKFLKEKGVDLPTQKYYEYALKSKKDKQDGYSGSFGWKKGELNLQSGYFQNNSKSDFTSEMWYMCSAPTIEEVKKCLYEKYGIYITSLPITKNKWYWELLYGYEEDKGWSCMNDSNEFNSPMEADSAAINYTLKNLIK